MRHALAGLMGLAVLGVALVAQQPATVTQTATIPARFQPVGPTEETTDYKFTVMLDTKAVAGAAGTCFLLIQSRGLSGMATVVLPASACQ